MTPADINIAAELLNSSIFQETDSSVKKEQEEEEDEDVYDDEVV